MQRQGLPAPPVRDPEGRSQPQNDGTVEEGPPNSPIPAEGVVRRMHGRRHTAGGGSGTLPSLRRRHEDIQAAKGDGIPAGTQRGAVPITTALGQASKAVEIHALLLHLWDLQALSASDAGGQGCRCSTTHTITQGCNAVPQTEGQVECPNTSTAAAIIASPSSSPVILTATASRARGKPGGRAERRV